MFLTRYLPLRVYTLFALLVLLVVGRGAEGYAQRDTYLRNDQFNQKLEFSLAVDSLNFAHLYIQNSSRDTINIRWEDYNQRGYIQGFYRRTIDEEIRELSSGRVELEPLVLDNGKIIIPPKSIKHYNLGYHGVGGYWLCYEIWTLLYDKSDFGFAKFRTNEVYLPRKGEQSTSSIPLQVEPVERVSGFSRDKLETKARIGFAKGLGRYAFDPASEDWYRKAVKLDTYYKPFDKGYIAPWKLIPTGERDVVEAYYEGSKDIDLSRVRFASAPDSPALPADYDEARRAWTLTLPATESNSTYEVFALYQGKVIGKLRVVSYPKHHYKLRLVPVNGQSVSELTALARELNAIYNPLAISFSLTESEGMQTAIDKSQLKRELRRLIRDYQEEHSLEADEVCVFVLSPTLSKGTKFEDLEGLMPRNSRFGYIFAGNSPNEAGSEEVASLARTLAHELGHGLFTLRHTFDSEYGTKKSRSKTSNLMDYSEGAKSLAAFQWNIIANPAPLTALDREREAQLRSGASCMVSITPEVSQKILASGKSILSASGEKIKLPPHAQITALFYKDTSEHPAPVGSLASFKLDSLSYLTYYNTKSSKFAGYKSSKEELYVEIKSKLSPVHIEIDEASHKVIVEGEEYQLSKSEFSCLSERDNPSKTIRFDLSRASKDKIAFGTAEWEKTQVALEKQTDLVNTFAQLVKDFDGGQSYLGEVLSDKLLAYEKLNGCKFVVVRAPSHVLSLNQSSWTDFAQAVFNKAGLGSRDILITIPYVKTHTLLTDGVVLHMPGLAYGSEVVIDDSKLTTSYDPSQSLPEFLSGASAQGVVQYIWDVFAQTKKKLRTINTLINYQGVIAISKPIDEVKTGIPSSYVFNLGVDSLYSDFSEEVRKYIGLKQKTKELFLKKKREEILNYAKTHNVGNIAFVSHGLNERIGISDPRHCEQFAQWYAYHVAKQVPHVKPVSSPLGECFYGGKNKVIYNETLDQFDRLSLGLSPFGFDWLADGLGAVYAGVNGELLEATTRAGFTFIPVLSAGTGRLTAKQIKEAVLNGELRLLKESGQSTPVIAQRANVESGLGIISPQVPPIGKNIGGRTFIKSFDVASEFQKGKKVVVQTFEWGGKQFNLKWTRVGNRIDFGQRSDLAKILGTSGGVEAHHIIPWELSTNHTLIQKAALDGFHPNMLENGIGLKKYSKLTGDGLHGNHPAYRNYIELRLDDFLRKRPNSTEKEANKTIAQLAPHLL